MKVREEKGEGGRRTGFEMTERFSSEVDDSTLFERFDVGFISAGEAKRVEMSRSTYSDSSAGVPSRGEKEYEQVSMVKSVI